MAKPVAIKGDLFEAGHKEASLYRLAQKIAKESACDDKHGVVIAKGGRVLAWATNRNVTHPISVRWLKQSIHAEQRALLKLGKQAKGSTAYCARNHRNSISMPCAMCLHLLKEAKVAQVVFSYQGSVMAYRL